MAQVSGTYSAFQAKGIREELFELISDISPEEVPYTSNIGTGDAESTFVEWQQDALATAAVNKTIEGDDTAFTAPAATVRIGNYTQIAKKSVLITGTLEAVRKAGRKSEVGYQMMRRAIELKRDVEFGLLNNNPALAGNDTTPRQTASLQNFIKTNFDVASGSTAPSYTNVPTASWSFTGTDRAFLETQLKSVMKQCVTQGGKPTMVLVGLSNKIAFSGFAGIAEVRFDIQGAAPTTIIGAADLYVSDFGNLAVTPDLFQDASVAYLVDPTLAKIRYLRPYFSEDLAKTGDGHKRHILVEYAHEVTNEKGMGLVGDLTTP